MDVRTDKPYWLMKNGMHASYPALTEDAQAEVVVIGAGITGALASYALAKAGLDVLVVDKRHPGMGSTAATTALLQYEIDEPLSTLIQIIGKDRAVAAYQDCSHSIDAIADIIEREHLDPNFSRRESLLYASSEQDVGDLQLEFAARREAGFAVQWLDRPDIEQRFRLSAPAAILSKQAAQVDAYLLAHQLLAIPFPNRKVYDKTEIVAIHTDDHGVRLALANGNTIQARSLVIACGYESLGFLSFDVADISSTFAFVSKPLDENAFWENRALVWETKEPYLYIRTTDDHRIIAGGRDTETYDPDRRDQLYSDKIRKLVADVERLFPHLSLTLDFGWAGAFAGTRDSLPFIGSVPDMDNTYFILGFGGNGITFSQSGATIVTDLILGKNNPMAKVYAFKR